MLPTNIFEILQEGINLPDSGIIKIFDTSINVIIIADLILLIYIMNFNNHSKKYPVFSRE